MKLSLWAHSPDVGVSLVRLGVASRHPLAWRWQSQSVLSSQSSYNNRRASHCRWVPLTPLLTETRNDNNKASHYSEPLDIFTMDSSLYTFANTNKPFPNVCSSAFVHRNSYLYFISVEAGGVVGWPNNIKWIYLCLSNSRI